MDSTLDPGAGSENQSSSRNSSSGVYQLTRIIVLEVISLCLSASFNYLESDPGVADVVTILPDLGRDAP